MDEHGNRERRGRSAQRGGNRSERRAIASGGGARGRGGRRGSGREADSAGTGDQDSESFFRFFVLQKQNIIPHHQDYKAFLELPLSPPNEDVHDLGKHVAVLSKGIQQLKKSLGGYSSVSRREREALLLETKTLLAHDAKCYLGIVHPTHYWAETPPQLFLRWATLVNGFGKLTSEDNPGKEHEESIFLIAGIVKDYLTSAQRSRNRTPNEIDLSMLANTFGKFLTNVNCYQALLAIASFYVTADLIVKQSQNLANLANPISKLLKLTASGSDEFIICLRALEKVANALTDEALQRANQQGLANLANPFGKVLRIPCQTDSPEAAAQAACVRQLLAIAQRVASGVAIDVDDTQQLANLGWAHGD